MNNSSQRKATTSSSDMTAAQRGRGTSPTDAFDPDSLTAQLVEVLDHYVEDLKAGQAPTREKLLADHPRLASQLDACLAGIEFIHGADVKDGSPPKRIGDFLIRHEVGRGGMGAVYEAEQVSLGRKVALKILRFGAVSDSEAIDRFKREAETVANLHHTNIVPIFSVGSEGGVNYYAMQFIEGRSLYQVAAESDGPLDAAMVAGWGLQAAEALTHAHHRDVIHRDVKPSNLLLDPEGRIWLTDFGLAKRLDDVTLSVTGALLGTPRYMSPEQAEATIKAVDHRTDIYSLGATLYELVTGEPVFAADTPHGIINQILTSEPLPPRKYRPNLPRDLETILLKCLSKEASQRYGTAQELAEDLRAVVEDRPIRARRPRIVERTARWLKKHKRSVLPTAVAVVVTLLAVGMLFGGRYAYSQWQQATLMLATRTPGLIAEVSSGGNAPRVEVLPTQEPLEVVSGDIKLHISGAGQLSQRLEMRLSAGQRKSIDVSLDDRRIGGKIPIERSFRLLPFSDGIDPILLNQKEIRRWDAEKDAAVWTLDMQQADGPLVVGAKKIRWPWRVHFAGYSTGDKFDQQPFVLGQLDASEGIDAHRRRDAAADPIDLDQDGEVDIVIASREQAWLLAVSGRTGKVLWLAARGADIDQQSSTPSLQQAFRSATIAPPLAAGDLNGDSVSDLIAMFGDIGSFDVRIAGPDLVPATLWFEAISGKTGETLWRSEINNDWLDVSAEKAELPGAFRWFVGRVAGSSARVWGTSAGKIPTGMLWRSRDREYERTGQFSPIPDTPRLVHIAPAIDAALERTPDSDQTGDRSLVFVAGRHIIQLDPRTGKLSGEPQDAGILTGMPARYADMDGDGRVDLVLCEEQPEKTRDEVFGMVAKIPQYRLAVWSLARNELLWQRDFAGHWPRAMEQDVAAPAWPLVSDLDGDGACELLVPDGTTNVGIHVPRQQPPSGQLAVIDGTTGEQRWKRQLFTLDQQLDHFIAGPDLNGDGTREVFVVSLWKNKFDLFVDALSGTDGSTLWRSQHALNRASDAPSERWVGRLAWWNGGCDGWPQLAVSVHPDNFTPVARDVCLFSAATGRLQQIAAGAEVVFAADVNRDGVGDLCAYLPPEEGVRRQGEVSLYCGVAAEYWRRLGDKRFPIEDLDGDGVRDLLNQAGRNRLEASSGLSGEALWASELDIGELRHFQVLSQRGDTVAGMLPRDEVRRRDFDQDGTPDLLVGLIQQQTSPFSPLQAISGRTGKLLWNAGFQITVCGGAPLADVHDLDGDGRAEIVYIGGVNLDYPQRSGQSSNEVQLWLMALSAEDGHVKWKRPLSPPYGQTPQFNSHRLRADILRIESPTVDLNGDGVLDLVVPAEARAEQQPVADAAVELIAVSGTDGSLLWRRELPPLRRAHGKLTSVPPVVATDLDGDGTAEIVTLEFEDTGQSVAQRLAHVQALEGGTGRVRWEWQGEVDSSYGEIDDLEEIHARPRPVVLNTNSGQPRFGILLRTRPVALTCEAVILDHAGSAVSRIPMVAIEGYAGEGHRLYPHDVDGDGNDELVFWNRQAIVAVRADASADIVWRRPFATRLNARLEGLLAGASDTGERDEPTVAVLRQGSGDNSLIGVDVRTGSVRWMCAGPTPRSGGGWIVPHRVELLGRLPDAPPLALFDFQSVSICQQAADTTAAVDRERTSPTADLTARRVRNIPESLRTRAVLNPGSADPRHLRDLPWRIRAGDPDVQQMIRIGKLSACYCFTMILLPGAILRSLVRRRRLDGLAIAALVAGLTSIWMGLTIGDAESETHLRIGRWVLALAQLPVIQFLGEPICQLVRGKWRRAFGWLAASVVVSIALATFVLAYHSSNPEFALQPSERYATAGWYMIGLWGGYVTGVMMLVVAAFRPVVHLVRSRVSRRRQVITS